MKNEQWKNARSIVSPTFSTAKLKAVNITCLKRFIYNNLLLQMYGLMNEISDMYNKRLLQYADKKEIFDIKTYVYLLLNVINVSLVLVL